MYTNGYSVIAHELFCVQTSMLTHVTHNYRGEWDPARRRNLFLITRTRTRVFLDGHLVIKLLLTSKGTRQLSDGAYGRDRRDREQKSTKVFVNFRMDENRLELVHDAPILIL